MEGNYPPGFYLPERDQQENRQQQQPPPQQQQQQQQHVAHYPFDLPIPYHTSSQHQSEYMEDQPTRVFPVPHPGAMAQMFSPVYHDSGPVHSSGNHLHHAHLQRPVAFGGHGVKFSSLPGVPASYTPPITAQEPAVERNDMPLPLPVTTCVPVVERTDLPTAMQESVVDSNIPPTKACESPSPTDSSLLLTAAHTSPTDSSLLPTTARESPTDTCSSILPATARESPTDSDIPDATIYESSRDSRIPATTISEQVTDSNIVPVTTSEVAMENDIKPVKSRGAVEERSIRLVTTHKPQTESNTLKDQDAAPGPSKQAQSKEQSEECQTSPHQSSATPPSPSSSGDEPQLFAALNLRKTSAITDLPISLSLRVASQDKVEGVIAKEAIEKGAEFGPYIGTLMNEEQGLVKDSSWELCITGKVFFYIDGRKTWMSHLRCALSEEEQNVEAYQYCGNIYFRSTKIIEPGRELRVFYSEDYGKCVGNQIALDDLRFDEDAQKFQCNLCEGLFTSAKLILRHIRCEHTSGKQDDMIPVLTWKKKRKKKYVAIEVSSKQQLATQIKVSDQEESTFKCGTCKKVFPSFGRLKAHELFHEKEQASPVNVKDSLTLSKQMKPQGSKQYECSECSKEYKSWRSLNRHEREAHGYRCDFCLERFPKKKDCLTHEQTHQAFKSSQPAGKTKASPAKSRASSTGIQPSEPAPDEPKDMLGRPTDYYKRPYKCRFCTKRYSSRTTAERHEKEVHKEEGDFKCSYCTKVFSTVSRLKDHLVLHKYVNMYRCAECPRSFASESALNNHRGEHTGLKPFKCEVCGRGFRTRKLALKHKRRIHQERPKRFLCTFCSKGFADKSDWKVHERRHKGIRQYVCLECGKGFTSSTSLAAHKQAMHIKVKPFSCAICSKSFALNHQYNHHMAKHRLEGEDNALTSMQQS